MTNQAFAYCHVRVNFRVFAGSEHPAVLKGFCKVGEEMRHQWADKGHTADMDRSIIQGLVEKNHYSHFAEWEEKVR